MVKFKSIHSYREFARSVQRGLRYIHSKESEEFLETVKATCRARKAHIPAGRVFWRAQHGHSWRIEKSDEGEEFEVQAPHHSDRMKPLRDAAVEGRANPKGIPYLYLSTQRDTAMSEVRPSLGSYVSAGHFKVLRALVVIACFPGSKEHDITSLDFILKDKVTAADIKRAVWGDINAAFAEPVERSDDSAEYAPTQIIAEVFKREGYDGIAYRSAFGEKGYNIALFDIGAAELTYCELHHVESIKFKFEECANPYWIKRGLKASS